MRLRKVSMTTNGNSSRLGPPEMKTNMSRAILMSSSSSSVNAWSKPSRTGRNITCKSHKNSLEKIIQDKKFRTSSIWKFLPPLQPEKTSWSTYNILMTLFSGNMQAVMKKVGKILNSNFQQKELLRTS